MDDHSASYTPNSTTTFGLVKENALDFTVMDELSYAGGWLANPSLPFSNPSNSSSSYLNSSDMTFLNQNLGQRYYEVGTEIKPLETFPHDYQTFFDNQTTKKRVIQAVEYLKASTRDVDVLIQLWLPVTRGHKRVLTTDNQPFVLNSDSKDLSNYRQISRYYQFATKNDSKELFGLPGLVFLKKFPMCSPDFPLVGEEDDPRISYAQKFNLCGSLNLPVFEPGSGTCLGVIEIVTTSQKVSFRNELHNVSKALEAVDLRSSEFLIHPKLEEGNGSYQVVLAEIREVLKFICDMHNLPLAQTWGLCTQKVNGGCQQQSAVCISVIASASYVFDPHVLGFYKACSEQHLLRGEGIVGKALSTNQPCFATDITAFGRSEYPLVHHARMFGLSGAVAIRLRSTYMGPTDFILEFFLPHDCKNNEEQKQVLSSISSVIQHVSRSLRVINDEELAEEASISVKETVTQDETSWISHMLEAQQRGESAIVSMGCHKEEPEEEFKVINQWNCHETRFYNGPTFSGAEKKPQLDLAPKKRSRSSGIRRSGEKRQVKTERNISLQVLRQYFPGSLKDAAKSIGVCPTTLKRICRKHGITRWPSRKIKKVGHSLQKLQLVIDSVQGVEGTMQLQSFYTNFPELSSSISPSPISKVNDCFSLFKSQTTSHSSSSGSHSSRSSLCCSTGNTLYTEKPCEFLKRPCSHSSFINDLPQDERKLQVRSQRDKFVDDHHSAKVSVPVPESSKPILQDEGVFSVKAAYGEKKIQMNMSQHCGLGDLQQEIMRRFNIDDMGDIMLKYLDDDFEWVLLTCDADLEECMDLSISSKNRKIKLFLHQSSHPKLGSSFT